jgi:hypothetical protein
MKCEYITTPDGTKIQTPPCFISQCYSSNLVRKVCIRCEKHVDNITPMMLIIEHDNEIIENRKIVAKHILNIKD